MTQPFLADPWRVQIATLPVRRQTPDEPAPRPSATRIEKMRAVMIANRKARQKDHEGAILRALKQKPRTLRELIEYTGMTKTSMHYLIKDLALRHAIRSEKIDGRTHWRA